MAYLELNRLVSFFRWAHFVGSALRGKDMT